MASRKSLQLSAYYGASHLRAINCDVQSEPTYSRGMRNDMNRAIALLEAAPDMVKCVRALVGYIEAGGMEDQHNRLWLARIGNRALERIDASVK